MMNDDVVTRRDFVLAGAVALPLLAARPWSFFTTVLRPVVYVCPPCGLPCDRLEFTAPGNCSQCGMTLIEKAAAPVDEAAVHFPPGTSSVRLPFDLLANAIFIPVTVGGSGPLNFGVDTGSYNSIVAAEIAPRLRLRTMRSEQGSGSGTTFDMQMIERLDVRLRDGVRVSTPFAAEIPLAALSALIARRYDGVLGADVLRHVVVELDYVKRIMTLHNPATYQPPEAAAWVPFSLWNGYDPQIAGALLLEGDAPIPVRMVLDTGAGGSTLTSPFVASHRLMSRLRTLPSPDVGAGGGESIKHSARIKGLRIGAHTMDRPIVALSTDTTGSLAHAGFDVNLGGNLLRRFRIVIDYPRQRASFEPNAAFERPFSSDASGLVLHAEGADHRRFVVRGVTDGSPAANAGMMVADVVVSLDGAPVDRYALWEFEEILQEDKRVCRLGIRRGPASLHKVIRLRALL